MKKLLAGLLALSLFSVGGLQANAQEEETVRIGIVNENSQDYWEGVAEKAAEEGINIELVLFADYVQPNEALANDSIDMNATQGYPFFLVWNEDNDADLVSIGNSIIAPLGLFSERHETLEDLPDGAVIAIPNDPSTYGRAFQALEQAGLIDVDESAGIYPEESDILDNPKGLEFEYLDPATAAVVLPDVDAAFINSGFAVDAGLTTDDAIFVDAEDLENFNPIYTNLIATREANKDNPTFLRIVELFQTEENAAVIDEITQGGEIPVWDDYTVEEIYEIADEIEILNGETE